MITLKNVRVHNLKGVDLTLPTGCLIVFTGVSGSGKSSLAFDTLYAEGQRRYIESLSNYSRRYMGNLSKPEADLIAGLSPTIAIEQKTAGKNPRSTVGTMTNIYDYLRVLFARIGVAHCPVSGERVQPQSSERILSAIFEQKAGSELLFLAPYVRGKKGEFKELFEELLRQGFMRIRLDGELVDLEEEIAVDGSLSHDIDLVVDRLKLQEEERGRIVEAQGRALELGEGLMRLLNQTTGEELLFSQHAYAEKSGLSYPPLEPHDFSFNHPQGMCPHCEGLGLSQEFDVERLIDPELSLSEDCCAFAGSYKTVKWGNIYNNLARLYKFKVTTPWKKLSEKVQQLLLYGNDQKWTAMRFSHPNRPKTWKHYVKWEGLLAEATRRYKEAKSALHRKKMEALMHLGPCSLCQGRRIQSYPAATEVGGKKIYELTGMTIRELDAFFKALTLSPFDLKVGGELLQEVQKRLSFLLNVGLHYLTLERTAPTLSGGEAQRVRLASQIGCGLVGTTYILDEPSIGLHPRDNTHLIATLKQLRDQGNTIIVVEHDEEMMEAADLIVDVGPGAGSQGGELVAVGTRQAVEAAPRSLTGAYLSGAKALPSFKQRKKGKERLTIKGATHHNLKGVDVEIPLGLFVAITGVSGSGKSSLISDILYPALANQLHHAQLSVGKHKEIRGMEFLDKVVGIDQSPIGRTPRSNPSTYIKLFDDIRDLFAKLPESQAAGFEMGRFSFNVKEGSCSECSGMGQICLDMDFMEDVWTPCPLCEGRRFDPKTLSITYKGKNINDILEMRVEEAHPFFEAIPSISKKLSLMLEMGMGYMRLGQSSTTLSGGEAQRIKLVREMIRPASGRTLYILDEPTTGLHFEDIGRLLTLLQQLVDRGNSVIVVEHNTDLIKRADWIIDLGPDGGKGGGEVIGVGTPRIVAKQESPTGRALSRKKERREEQAPSQKRVSEIIAKGCYQNNLKGIDVTLPRGKISICTGPSGSGKSSFAFETIYAEGQRRYTASLSPYARQFIKQMARPKVEEITGLSPAIAIEQKRHAGNPRSTLGTMTEVYDFLRLLFAHEATAYCPETGERIEAITKERVVERVMALPEKTPLHILSPLHLEKGEGIAELQERLIAQGFLRVRLNGTYYLLDEGELPYKAQRKNALFLVVDRLYLSAGCEKRLFEAIEQAVRLSKEPFIVATDQEELLFNLAFSVPSTGKSYPPLTPHTFSFNAEEGMCPHCLGLGVHYGANLASHKEIMSLSPLQLAHALWQQEDGESLQLFHHFLKEEGILSRLPLHTLSPEALEKIMNGSERSFTYKQMELRWAGINRAFSKISTSGMQREKEGLAPFLAPSLCSSCNGERLNPLARSAKLQGETIGALCALPLGELLPFIRSLPSKKETEELLTQLTSRLTFLCNIGLDYLSLSRSAPTLSGGETQRIHLARQLGSGLTGCLYVLDEPTIGLHPYNNARLNEALKGLRALGNTLLMVEHDPLTLEIADEILDFGPKAGRLGGELIARGSYEAIQADPRSLTGSYLSGKKGQQPQRDRRSAKAHLHLENCTSRNLKNLSLSLPLNSFTCVCGVSGSGKSTLINHLLRKGIERHLATDSRADHTTFEGATIRGLSQIDKLIVIDQNPIGTTIRADVSTYTEINGYLRSFFASLNEARLRGLEPKHFSHNHLNGMCKSCWGLGFKKINLQFLPSVEVTCDSCRGCRLNPLSLEVTYKGKNLGELLKLTAIEALDFLPPIDKLENALQKLLSVGLGYLTLGQTIQSLSGGEAGRLRLARELSKRGGKRTLYLFDEPTIGLHADDIQTLLPIFHALVDKGGSLIIIEHNSDVLRAADYLIDLGPGAGPFGGELIAAGTPEEVAEVERSYTGKYLFTTAPIESAISLD